MFSNLQFRISINIWEWVDWYLILLFDICMFLYFLNLVRALLSFLQIYSTYSFDVSLMCAQYHKCVPVRCFLNVDVSTGVSTLYQKLSFKHFDYDQTRISSMIEAHTNIIKITQQNFSVSFCKNKSHNDNCFLTIWS